MAKCPKCGAPDRLQDNPKAVYDFLVELQKVIPTAKTREMRDLSFHAVIEIRAFVKDHLLDT